MSAHTTLWAGLVLATFIAADTTLDAAPLNVDITRENLSGGGSGLLEPGYEEFAANEGGGNPPVTFLYPNDEIAGTGNSVEVTISG